MDVALALGGSATFRSWVQLATAAYFNGAFGGLSLNGQTESLLLAKNANGYRPTLSVPLGKARANWVPLEGHFFDEHEWEQRQGIE